METIGISNLVGLFLFKTEGEIGSEGKESLIRPLGLGCSFWIRTSLNGEDGEEGFLRASGELETAAAEEVLQNKEAETRLDGEKTGEFEIATVHDMFVLSQRSNSSVMCTIFFFFFSFLFDCGLKWKEMNYPWLYIYIYIRIKKEELSVMNIESK